MLEYFKSFCDTNNKMTLKKQLRYWTEVLTEKCVNIFRWSGLPDSIPQKEIELALTFRGFCGIIVNDGKYWATMGSMSGVTPYPDEFTKYLYATPKFSGWANYKKLYSGNSNVAIISNNYTKLSTYDLIRRYAYLFAHADLTFQAVLINIRSTGILAAQNQQQADSLNAWYSKLVKGDTMAIVDKDDLSSLISSQGLRSIANQYPSSSMLSDVFNVHDNLMRSFFNDIGLPMSKNKKEREIEAEISQDNARILFNVNDMLEMRKEGCREVQRVFGEIWEVELSDEYKQVTLTSKGGDEIGGKEDDKPATD